ncbi:hypothetical protein HBB16_19030 [Pseudonocardia sp. MCCB 268]|nr:hypothetical protein [Pseudonocardia cytotoxica]
MQAQAEADPAGRTRDPAALPQVRRTSSGPRSPRSRDYCRGGHPPGSARWPTGWETEDYIDQGSPLGEGMIPVKIKMTIDSRQRALRPVRLAPVDDAQRHLGARSRRSRPAPRCSSRTSYQLGSTAWSPWSTSVTRQRRQRRLADPVRRPCSGPFEKIMNSVFEIWSKILPERAGPARSTWSTCRSAAA